MRGIQTDEWIEFTDTALYSVEQIRIKSELGRPCIKVSWDVIQANNWEPYVGIFVAMALDSSSYSPTQLAKMFQTSKLVIDELYDTYRSRMPISQYVLDEEFEEASFDIIYHEFNNGSLKGVY